MPQVFKLLQSARVYPELITRRLGDLWHICMGLFYPPKQKPVKGNTNDKELNGVFVRKETTVAEPRLCYSSFESMMKRGIIPETVGSMIVKFHFNVAFMTLETTLHTKFTDTPKKWDAVDRSREILVGLQSGLSPKLPSMWAW
jgi:hypothetical protein